MMIAAMTPSTFTATNMIITIFIVVVDFCDVEKTYTYVW